METLSFSCELNNNLGTQRLREHLREKEEKSSSVEDKDVSKPRPRRMNKAREKFVMVENGYYMAKALTSNSQL